MKFIIIEVDKDYHTITSMQKKDFNNLKSAENWCKENSWSGYDYFVSINDLNSEAKIKN